MELKDLVGQHVLNFSAVEITNPFDADGNGIAFFLDGKVFLALEDSNDGYRSCMGAILSGEASPYSIGIDDYENINRPVVCRHLENGEGDGDGCDILEIIDCETGHIWLRVGTRNTDGYYPSFISKWSAMPTVTK